MNVLPATLMSHMQPARKTPLAAPKQSPKHNSETRTKLKFLTIKTFQTVKPGSRRQDHFHAPGMAGQGRDRGENVL